MVYLILYTYDIYIYTSHGIGALLRLCQLLLCKGFFQEETFHFFHSTRPDGMEETVAACVQVRIYTYTHMRTYTHTHITH
jgi:hypothetical protein